MRRAPLSGLLFLFGALAASSADPVLESLRVAPGLTIRVAADAPDVSSPTALCFDTDGRMVVVDGETVRLLLDRNNDGLFESSRIFAQDLQQPGRIVPWKNGFYVESGSNVYYLKDTNGDTRADVRELVYSFQSLKPNRHGGPFGMLSPMSTKSPIE
ncbi:MAG: hypothetical protein AAF492_09630, partial [Verrucomicrobiota bacterium]